MIPWLLGDSWANFREFDPEEVEHCDDHPNWEDSFILVLWLIPQIF
jgi:hypothetical protein